ncbi:HAD family hydrolase [Pelorhabdus rhamnosifermentans]|uniref:HAD family hydrolase n=1 Tax=Pelorhabdus rhamnosifermentans TaxID=2772457 RepID=UPI001FE58174|nr:HAD family phosphatase [Pelorhabdus rhamnosifermentans]
MMMSTIKAVIFDLDGTLIDSESNYLEAERRLFADYGFTNYNMEIHSQYIGFGSKEMMEDMKKKYHIHESIENLLAGKNRYYSEIARKNTVVFPEMQKFLELLHVHDYPLALASGSSPAVIDEILEITQLRKYFQVVLSAEDVKQGKPEPDIFLEAAEQLQKDPEHCLVVEDSHFGVEAAKRASMYCIALPSPEMAIGEDFMQADLLLRQGVKEFLAEKAFAWLKERK